MEATASPSSSHASPPFPYDDAKLRQSDAAKLRQQLQNIAAVSPTPASSSSYCPCPACFPSPHHHNLLVLNRHGLSSPSPLLSGDELSAPPLISDAAPPTPSSSASSPFRFSYPPTSVSPSPLTAAYTSSSPAAFFSASNSPFASIPNPLFPPSLLIHPAGDVLPHSSESDCRSCSSPSGALRPPDLEEAVRSSFSFHQQHCDIYVGIHGGGYRLSRFTRWLVAELEQLGIPCFTAHRAGFVDSGSHDMALQVMNSCVFGLVIVTKETFADPYGVEELQVFSERGNLVPIFFGVAPSDCIARDIVEKQGEAWEVDGGELWRWFDGDEKTWAEAVDGIRRAEEKEGWNLRANGGNWRDCILRAANIIGTRLGKEPLRRRRRSNCAAAESAANAGGGGGTAPELPYPRNAHFVGRDKELKWLERIHYADTAGNDDGKWRRTHRPPFHDRCNTVGDDRSRTGGRTNRRQWPGVVAKGGGIAVVSGPSGIGKTEMVVEYAHRFRQRYRRVLWVGGEARYLRQNYLNLYAALDLGADAKTNDEEDEEISILLRVKRELQRADVPYLLVIDNLESERDWWDGRHVSELIPASGAAHVVITARRILQHATAPPPFSLELAYLSGVEALSLMKRRKEVCSQDLDALKEMESKLQRRSLGLGIVGTLLSEISVTPVELLQKIEASGSCESRSSTSGSDGHDGGGDTAISARFGAFFAKLLDVCLSYVEDLNGKGGLSTRMALVGAWFGPFPVPLSLLVCAAAHYEQEEKKDGRKLFSGGGAATCVTAASSCRSKKKKKQIATAAEVLLRCGIARKSSRQGWIEFQEAWRTYGRRRGGARAAMAMVEAVRKSGAVSLHWEHFWAACFLVFHDDDDDDHLTLQLGATASLPFIRKAVLQLAALAGCRAALELLRLGAELLEGMERSGAEGEQRRRRRRCCCWETSGGGGRREAALLRAEVLDMRAKVMEKVGRWKEAEEIWRESVGIREEVLGERHPDTMAAQETLRMLLMRRRRRSGLVDHALPAKGIIR